MKKKNKDTVWKTSGIFSIHYLLGCLTQKVYKLNGLTNGEFEIVEGKGVNQGYCNENQ